MGTVRKGEDRASFTDLKKARKARGIRLATFSQGAPSFFVFPTRKLKWRCACFCFLVSRLERWFVICAWKGVNRRCCSTFGRSAILSGVLVNFQYFFHTNMNLTPLPQCVGLGNNGNSSSTPTTPGKRLVNDAFQQAPPPFKDKWHTLAQALAATLPIFST